MTKSRTVLHPPAMPSPPHGKIEVTGKTHLARDPMPPAAQELAALLAERICTHGPFPHSAAIAQDIKEALRSGYSWEHMMTSQREAAQMIATKLARIVAGDPHHKDHWNDIAGYAQLISDPMSALPR